MHVGEMHGRGKWQIEANWKSILLPIKHSDISKLFQFLYGVGPKVWVFPSNVMEKHEQTFGPTQYHKPGGNKVCVSSLICCYFNQVNPLKLHVQRNWYIESTKILFEGDVFYLYLQAFLAFTGKLDILLLIPLFQWEGI